MKKDDKQQVNQANVPSKAPSLDSIRKQTRNTIVDACQSTEWTLVEAPPSSGKTTAAIELADQLNVQITYLTQRERLYEQAKNIVINCGLSFGIIPSPHRTCPTFNEAHGKTWEKRVKQTYNLGVGGARLHYELQPFAIQIVPIQRSGVSSILINLMLSLATMSMPISSQLLKTGSLLLTNSLKMYLSKILRSPRPSSSTS